MSSLNKKVILHLTSLSSGGGGIVTMNIHQNCLDFGYESYVVIRGRECVCPDGSRKEITLTRKFYWNKLRRFLFRQIVKRSQIDAVYSMYNLCERFTCYSAKDILLALPKTPDIIFVHWVSDFANAKIIADLKRMTGAKILFLMVDHALYSGGCHYQLDCEGYKDGCHNCPATNSRLIKCGIERNYVFKKKHLPEDIYVAVRGAEKQRLRQSAIYKNCHQELVVFPIDETKYRPSSNRAALREKWNVPIGSKIVLIGATHLGERRKGMKLVEAALEKVKNDVVLLVAGNMDKQMAFGKESIVLGLLNENQLIETYQMADVFVCPSLADSGPLMVKQSCLCGTPVVAFPVGVSIELVENGETGYLANYGDVDDLANGIDTITMLSDENWREMSIKCRERAVQLFSTKVGNSIDDLIKRLCE